MKWLIFSLAVLIGTVAWLTAGYCGILRQEKVRESREAIERNEHRDAGELARKPPLESQSIRLVSSDDKQFAGDGWGISR